MILPDILLKHQLTRLATRSLQLGIQRRPYFPCKTLKRPDGDFIMKLTMIANGLATYAAYFAAFGTLGYFFNGVEERQFAQIERRKKELLESRARRAAAGPSSTS